jgi:mRNA interferase RelE/StbE
LAWVVEYSKEAVKDLKKMDKFVAKKIVQFITSLEKLDNPKEHAKQLKGNLSNAFSFRFEDYRILCSFEDEKIIIYVLTVGHRKNVYI